MTTYHLVPDGKTWMVKTAFGSIVSQGHRTKAGAKRAMNRAATVATRRSSTAATAGFKRRTPTVADDEPPDGCGCIELAEWLSEKREQGDD